MAQSSIKVKCPFAPNARHGFRRLGYFSLPSLQIIAVVMLLGTAWAPSAVAEGLTAMSAQRSPVRGVVRASAQAIISTDLTARVVKIGFREGVQFYEGDVLVEFDCRRHKAELASAKAQHREMLVAFKSATYLKQRKAGNRQDVETTRARADRAAAEADVIRAQLDQCTITAPFDGRVAKLGIHEHEMPAAGNQLFFIVATRKPKIELIVPSKWLKWLEPGTKFKFQVDDTSKSYDGVVRRLGAAVDTVSQTIKVFAEFTGPTPDILPGMSGTARFKSYAG